MKFRIVLPVCFLAIESLTRSAVQWFAVFPRKHNRYRTTSEAARGLNVDTSDDSTWLIPPQSGLSAMRKFLLGQPPSP
jgi:hypothetical protein